LLQVSGQAIPTAGVMTSVSNPYLMMDLEKVGGQPVG